MELVVYSSIKRIYTFNRSACSEIIVHNGLFIHNLQLSHTISIKSIWALIRLRKSYRYIIFGWFIWTCRYLYIVLNSCWMTCFVSVSFSLTIAVPSIHVLWDLMKSRNPWPLIIKPYPSPDDIFSLLCCKWVAL